ncbi:MAG: CHAP domain-containing protein [Pedobacter sp.]
MFGSSFIRKNENGYGRIIKYAREEIGVRETNNANSGIRVEAYLAYVGFEKGAPWCAAFVSWVYNKAGYKLPKSAWSPALFPHSKRSKEPEPGMIFGIYFPNLKRVGHCGIVESIRNDWLTTIEGNTNALGSREGDGVYRKLRKKQTIRYYSNWIH